MQTPRRALALLAILLLAPLLATIPASAGNGLGCGLAGLRLEGECYATPDAGCDPDWDGERTQIVAIGDASGQRATMLPNTGCGLTFPAVGFDGPMRPVALRAQATGSDTRYTFEVTIAADGVVLGSGTFRATQRETGQLVAVSRVAEIPEGAHTIRVTWTTDGPSYLNLFLDHVDFERVFPPCEPAAPRIEAECGFTPDPGCAPDWQGESTEPIDVPGASGGSSLFLPNVQCGVTYENVTFAQPAFLSLMRAQVTGSHTRYTFAVDVYVDDVRVGTGRFAANQTESARNVTTVSGDAVPAGIHTVRIVYATSGPWYLNLLLDHVEFAPLCGLADGMLGGECFTHVDPGCFPDARREHTTRLAADGAQGGMVALIPHDACGVTFAGVHFEDDVVVASIVAKTTGSGIPHPVRIDVLVDGLLVAEGAMLSSQTSPLAEASMLRQDVIPAGVHDVRVRYSVPTDGAMNLLLDVLAFEAPAALPTS